MKALVFLLVLANLLFYAFTAGYFGRPDNADASRVEQQVHPERLHVVSRGEPPGNSAVKAASPVAEVPAQPEPAAEIAADKPAGQAGEKAADRAEAKPADKKDDKDNGRGSDKNGDKTQEKQTCLVWRKLSVADADKLAGVISQRFAAYKIDRRGIPGDAGGWWVHIPPLSDKATQEKKIAELRELGVTDFFPVQDGAAKLAISLGIFSTEKAAQDQLASLKAKGVRSARIGSRPGKDALVRIEANGPLSSRAEVISATAKVLSGAEPQACP